MNSNVRLIIVILLCLASFLCNKPTNPFTNAENVRVEFSIDDTVLCELSEVLTCSLSVSLFDLVDSIVLSFGSDELDTIIHPVSGTVPITHLFASAGMKELKAVAYAGSSRPTAIAVIDVGSKPVMSDSGHIIAAGPAYLDSSIELSVSIVSGGASTFQWFKNNTAISGANSSVLQFAALTSADAGEYYCIIANAYGTAVSVKLVLNPQIAGTGFLLTIQIIGNGDVLPASGSYARDTVLQLVAQPDSGWVFAGWSDSLTDTATIASCAMNSNKTVTATFRVAVIDSIAPAIRLVDSTLDSTHISGSTRFIQAIATDNISIDTVIFRQGALGFPSIKDNDSLYYATATNLPANLWSTISVIAFDKAGNGDSLHVSLYFDPLMADDTPPAILQQSGPQHNSRVTSASGNISLEISDDSGVRRAWFAVDGDSAGDLISAGNGLYDLNYNFAALGYGFHTIIAYADDNSSQSNQATMTIRLNYNSTISAFAGPYTPANNAAGLQSFSFSWNGADDLDGDTVTYAVFYGTSALSLPNKLLAGYTKSVAASALSGNAVYYWKARAYSATYSQDSIESSLFTFTTYNTPPDISLITPAPAATGVSDKPTFAFNVVLGDNDTVSVDILAGQTNSVSSMAFLGTVQFPAETFAYTGTALNSGAQYFWCAIAHETAGAAQASDTSTISTFYTANNAPVWSSTVDTSSFRNQSIAINLAQKAQPGSLGAGHALVFSLVNLGGGSAQIVNNNLLWKRPWNMSADTSVVVRATDTWTYGPTYTDKMIVISENLSGPAGMRFIPAAGDSFQMGQIGIAFPVHTVKFTHNLWVDSAEVTQGNYSAVMGTKYTTLGYNNPAWSSTYGQGNQYPAYSITWHDAALYCNAKSIFAGLDTVYTYSSISGTPGNGCTLNGLVADSSKPGFRLLTEAEWEYSCRAKTTSDFYWTSTDTALYAWYAGNNTPVSGSKIVGQKLPNLYGLYDMSGNLQEWCCDWYGSYPDFSQTNPWGISAGGNRIIRGGHYGSGGLNISSATRAYYPPEYGSTSIGFRICRYEY